MTLALLVISYLAVTPVAYEVAEVATDKVNHLVAFFALAALADASFPRPGIAWRTTGALLAYGAAIEIVQAFLPFRSCSAADMAANALGLALYAAVAAIARRVVARARREA